jgi:hypothetical protein
VSSSGRFALQDSPTPSGFRYVSIPYNGEALPLWRVVPFLVVDFRNGGVAGKGTANLGSDAWMDLCSGFFRRYWKGSRGGRFLSIGARCA